MRKDSSGRVLFRFTRLGRGPVYLAGDFNGWDIRALPMEPRKDGTWTRTVRLAPGRYAYKFFCRGDWYNDPEAEAYAPNPWGSTHSTVVVRRAGEPAVT